MVPAKSIEQGKSSPYRNIEDTRLILVGMLENGHDDDLIEAVQWALQGFYRILRNHPSLLQSSEFEIVRMRECIERVQQR